MTIILRAARKAVSLGILLCFGAGVSGHWAAIRLRGAQKFLTNKIELRRRQEAHQ